MPLCIISCLGLSCIGCGAGSFAEAISKHLEITQLSQTRIGMLHCFILSVSDQNGVSLQWYIVEIYHSGRKPLILFWFAKHYWLNWILDMLLMDYFILILCRIVRTTHITVNDFNIVNKVFQSNHQFSQSVNMIFAVKKYIFKCSVIIQCLLSPTIHLRNEAQQFCWFTYCLFILPVLLLSIIHFCKEWRRLFLLYISFWSALSPP